MPTEIVNKRRDMRFEAFIRDSYDYHTLQYLYGHIFMFRNGQYQNIAVRLAYSVWCSQKR